MARALIRSVDKIESRGFSELIGLRNEGSRCILAWSAMASFNDTIGKWEISKMHFAAGNVVVERG